MTNGISVPFRSSNKTGTMIETATTARSAIAFAESASSSEDTATRAYCKERIHGLRGRLCGMFSDGDDAELKDVRDSYTREIDEKEE